MSEKKRVSVIRVTKEDVDIITDNIRRITGNPDFKPTTNPPDYVRKAMEEEDHDNEAE